MEQNSEMFINDQILQLGFEYFITRYGIEFSKKTSVEIGGLNFDTFDQFLARLDSVLTVEIYPPLDNKGLPPGRTFSDLTCSAQGFSRAPDNKNSVSPSEDLFRYLGYMFSGNLEPKLKEADRKERQLLIKTAFSDAYCNNLLCALRVLHDNEGIPFVFKTFWPEGRPFAVCLTHDVDETKKTYQWLTRPFRLLLAGNFQGLFLQSRSFYELIKGKEPYWTFDAVTQMEKKYHCVSSFYFLYETAPSRLTNRSSWRHLGRKYNFSDKPVTQLIRALAGQGFEVGLHGSFHSYIDLNLLQKEKAYLESFLQITVRGCRQHNLNLSIPETWRIQDQVGLMYDTTLGFNDCVGFRWGTCLPFHPYDPSLKKHLNLLEIPLVIEDLPFFLETDRNATFLTLCSEVARNQGVLTLLWHHNVVNPYEYPGWGVEYEKMIDYVTKKDAWVTSGLNIAQWWTEREKAQYHTEFMDNTLTITYATSPVHLTISHPDTLTFESIQNATIIKSDRNCLIIRTQITSDQKKISLSFKGASNVH